MCFSANASLATAIGTGAIGILALSRAQRIREFPLAAIPLIFAVQQTAEGLLWLDLAAHGPTPLVSPLANIFAAVALSLWPSYAPLSVALTEENRERRLAMWALFAIGALLSTYGLWGLAAHPYGVCIAGHSLLYSNGTSYPPIAMAAYIACTCLPFILSTHTALRWFGLIVVVGLIVSSVLYYSGFFSVWCFFAAGGSLVIYGHFSRLKSARPIKIARQLF